MNFAKKSPTLDKWNKLIWCVFFGGLLQMPLHEATHAITGTFFGYMPLGFGITQAPSSDTGIAYIAHTYWSSATPTLNPYVSIMPYIVALTFGVLMLRCRWIFSGLAIFSLGCNLLPSNFYPGSDWDRFVSVVPNGLSVIWLIGIASVIILGVHFFRYVLVIANIEYLEVSTRSKSWRLFSQ